MRARSNTLTVFILLSLSFFGCLKRWHDTNSGVLDRIWRVKFNKFRALREAQIARIIHVDLGKVPEKEAYDLIEPVLGCEDETRFGAGTFNTGDGPKFVCGVGLLSRYDHCVVYSIGSAYDFTFEVAVRQVAEQCEIHTFDGTMNLSSRPLPEEVHVNNINFHNWNIVSDCDATKYDAPSKCIQDTLKLLQHEKSVLTWLKIDCEGCEYSVIPQIVRTSRIDQVMMEVHGTNAEQIMHLFQTLRDAGIEVFHKERNHWGCDGYRCVEFSLMSLAYAKRVLGTFVRGDNRRLNFS